MHFSSHKRRNTPSVIIVSLIDVLLVVLIFLMVTTTLKRADTVLKLTLPQSKIAQPGSQNAKPLIITIASNAPYFFLADQPVTYATLQAQLESAAQRDPQLKVAIRADKNAPFGEVTRVIDAAKLAQVGGLDFFTDKPQGRGP
ncbi:MAG: biopolymer transporter ExbD [Verrucomicrobia bacterium]|nr:biopolymer transporter ExbD [Verrucomicrobiota bacterium]